MEEKIQRAYPFENGQWDKWITVDERSVTFVGQTGPIKECGENGCQIDKLIEFARKVLEAFNNRVPCRENSLAITKLQEAELWLLQRTREREARGVEGTGNA